MGLAESTKEYLLVYRLLNLLSFTAVQLVVFQGASDVPISVSYGSSNAENSQLAAARRGR